MPFHGVAGGDAGGNDCGDGSRRIVFGHAAMPALDNDQRCLLHVHRAATPVARFVRTDSDVRRRRRKIALAVMARLT
jgi:hypothetical protein